MIPNSHTNPFDENKSNWFFHIVLKVFLMQSIKRATSRFLDVFSIFLLPTG